MKSIFRVAVSLALSVLLFFGSITFVSTIRDRINIQKTSPVPALSKEESISFFNENKENLETIKNYLLTKPTNYKLDETNFKAIVNNDEVKSVTEYLFSLNCQGISRGENTVSFEFEGEYCSSGIVYFINSKVSASGYNDLNLEGNWWHYTWPYLYNDRIKPFSPLMLVTVSIVSFILSYLLTGLLSPFRKKKKTTSDE